MGAETRLQELLGQQSNTNKRDVQIIQSDKFCLTQICGKIFFFISQFLLRSRKLLRFILIFFLINIQLTQILCGNCQKYKNNLCIECPPFMILKENNCFIGDQNCQILLPQSGCVKCSIDYTLDPISKTCLKKINIKYENKIRRLYNLKQDDYKPVNGPQKNQNKTSNEGLQEQYIYENPYSEQGDYIVTNFYEKDYKIKWVILSNQTKPTYRQIYIQDMNGYQLSHVVPRKFNISIFRYTTHHFSYSNLQLLKNMTIYKAMAYYLNRYYAFSTYNYNSEEKDQYFENRKINWKLIKASTFKNYTHYFYRLVYQMIGNQQSQQEYFTFSYSNVTYQLKLLDYYRVPFNYKSITYLTGDQSTQNVLKAVGGQEWKNNLIRTILEQKIINQQLYNESIKLVKVSTEMYYPFQNKSEQTFMYRQFEADTNKTYFMDIKLKYYYPVNLSLDFMRFLANQWVGNIVLTTFNNYNLYYTSIQTMPSQLSPIQYVQFRYQLDSRQKNKICLKQRTVYPKQKFTLLHSFDLFFQQSLSVYANVHYFRKMYQNYTVSNYYRSFQRKGVYRMELITAQNQTKIYEIDSFVQPLQVYQVQNQQIFLFQISIPLIPNVKFNTSNYQYIVRKLQQNITTQQEAKRQSIRPSNSGDSSSAIPPYTTNLDRFPYIEPKLVDVDFPICLKKQPKFSLIYPFTSKTGSIQGQSQVQNGKQMEKKQIQMILEQVGIEKQRVSDLKIIERNIYITVLQQNHDVHYCNYVLQFFDKGIGEYVRVQFDVVRNYRSTENLSTARLIQNQLFKSELFQLPENNKRKKDNYTNTLFFETAGWPIYLYDGISEQGQKKTLCFGLPIYAKKQPFLLQSSNHCKNSSLYKMVDGFREIFVSQDKLSYYLHQFLFYNQLNIVYRKFHTYVNPYASYITLVREEVAHLFRYPIKTFLNRTIQLNQSIIVNQADQLRKVHRISVLPISYSRMGPSKKQFIIRPLAQRYYLLAQINQIYKIIEENIIQSIPVNVKLQMKSIRLVQMVYQNSSSLVLHAVTLHLIDRVNFIIYTQMVVFLQNDTKKIFKIQYCKDGYKGEYTSIHTQNINVRQYQQLIQVQSTTLLNLARMLQVNDIITHNLKSKKILNKYNIETPISINNPILIRRKRIGAVTIAQLYYELEHITIKAITMYKDTTTVKFLTGRNLRYQFIPLERKPLLNGLPQLRKLIDQYKNQQIEKIKQRQEFMAIWQSIKSQDITSPEKISHIYLKIWEKYFQYYMEINGNTENSYQAKILYDRHSNLVLFKGVYNRNKDIIEGGLQMKEFVNQYKQGYEQVSVIKGCNRVLSLGKACLQCRKDLYLSKDGFCYDKLRFCTVQSGKLCLQCQFGRFLTENYQCI